MDVLKYLHEQDSPCLGMNACDLGQQLEEVTWDDVF